MMNSRGRVQSQLDWDPMQDEFDDSTYNQQYNEEGSSGGVNLDHCRLYITNIPLALNEVGLRAAFCKYGTLTEVHISKNPQKRYGLITYETPGEAKHAMSKLNRTEPLKLNISIAHKKKPQDRPKEPRERPAANWERHNTSKDETTSNCSRRNLRKTEELTNGDNNLDDCRIDENVGLDDTLDPDVNLELELLRLEQLKVKEEQLLCKHRILLKQAEKKASAQSSSTRCIMPDGRIVVRTVDRTNERDGDSSFGAGAGDSLNIPGLQRVALHECVACGARADVYCGRCGVTPYCSAQCQRRDWFDRHRAVCHNLARLSGAGTEAKALNTIDSNIPPSVLRNRQYDGKDTMDYCNYLNSLSDAKSVAPAPLPAPAPASAALRQPHSPVKKPSNKREGERSADRPANASAGRGRNSHRSGIVNKPPPRPLRLDPSDEDEKWDKGKPSTPQAGPSKAPVKTLPQKEAIKSPPDSVEAGKSPVPKFEPAQSSAQAPLRKPFEAQKMNGAKQEVEKAALKPPGSVRDATPAKKLVPRDYLVGTLSVGESFLLSVDATGAECRCADAGALVCLSMHERHEAEYEALCGDYAQLCDADTLPYTPSPGDSFSLRTAADGAWYRARCVAGALAALLDSGRVVPIDGGVRCARLPPAYRDVPEFCCVLSADNVKVGDSLQCTLVSVDDAGCEVSLESVETGAPLGRGRVARWLPTVDAPPKATPTPTSTSTPTPATNITNEASASGVVGAGAGAGAAARIPEVPRPPLAHGERVLLVEAETPARALLRPAALDAQRRYDAALHDVLMYGETAEPLSEPPRMGQVVIGKFSDGLHYRALCKRTGVKQNKYLLEYIEYGNVEVTPLERIYPCPAHLQLGAMPTVVTAARLDVGAGEFTPPARRYVDKLKEDNVEMILSLPSGSGSVESGGAVSLTETKRGVCVDKRLRQLCAPDWQRLQDEGVDLLETECVMYSQLEHLELPAGGCELDVLDVSTLDTGHLSACPRGAAHAQYVINTLPEKMAEYCASEIGREPYLPRPEELCIAPFPPMCSDARWYRAVMCEQVTGAGGATASVMYVDFGNVESVPVKELRKMLPEFVRDLPALAVGIDICDFPKPPTEKQLERALLHMRVDEDGRGVLTVERCEPDPSGVYQVRAPQLLRAMAD